MCVCVSQIYSDDIIFYVCRVCVCVCGLQIDRDDKTIIEYVVFVRVFVCVMQFGRDDTTTDNDAAYIVWVCVGSDDIIMDYITIIVLRVFTLNWIIVAKENI